MDPSPQVTADTERAEAQLEGLMNRIENMNRLEASAEVNVSIDQARSDLDAAEAKLKALQGAKAEMVVEVDADAAEDSFDEMGDAAEEAGGGAGKRAGNALLEGLNSTPVVGAIAGIVVAAGGFIVDGIIDALNDRLRAEDVFGAKTGLDEATSRKFGAAAGAAYGNAWGESVEANLDTARRALENGLIDEDSTGREVQAVTEQLTALAEIMDVDVMEAAEAAGNMIKNGLAGNAEEAFDVILAGQQEGLNRSEDWLDTLREYSGMFESLGLSGAEAGGLIAQAMEDGARNSDVAADALKEFSIRAQDDSKATRQAFQDLGLDADEMGTKISKGGDTAKEGLDEVLDGLRSIEDPMARNAAGVALFGTMWEDMGNGAGVLAMDLDDLGDSWVNVGDTTQDAMNRMSDNAATAWESMKRNVTNSATEVLAGIASVFEDPVMDLSGWVSTHTAEILGFLIDAGGGFFALARAATEFAATTIEALGTVAGGLDVIVDGTGKAVEALGHLTGDQGLVDLGLGIQESADQMTQFSESADGMADTLRTNVGGALDEAEAKFNDWTGPALMQAEINDAIAVMVQDLDSFVAYVDGLPGGTITINGDTTGGEEAMNTLIAEVSESNGTVNINGETVEAEDALQRVKDLAAEGAEITVTANTGPAEAELNQLGPYTVPVGADTSPADQEVGEWTGLLSDQPPTDVPVGADTSGAEEEVHVFGSQVGDVPTAPVQIDADTEYGEAELRAFQQSVNDSGGTVDINGEPMNAEQALSTLETEINAGGGVVNINGTYIDAATALTQLTSIIDNSEGTVTIDGNNVPANLKTEQAKRRADNTTGTIDVDADTGSAESSANHAARDRNSSIDVDARTAGANAAINAAARSRTAYINVVATGAVGLARAGLRNAGFATGGRVPGYGAYSSGYGVVPGPSAPYGVDNVLWPSHAPVAEGRATGGPILSQPLAGGEWVVNPVSSKQHDATLRAINAGATRAELAASLGAGASAGPSTLVLDGAALGAIASAVRTGASQATIAMSDRVAASTYQRGASASRAYGGAS